MFCYHKGMQCLSKACEFHGCGEKQRTKPMRLCDPDCPRMEGADNCPCKPKKITEHVCIDSVKAKKALECVEEIRKSIRIFDAKGGCEESEAAKIILKKYGFMK
jgi:hypothetical protein